MPPTLTNVLLRAIYSAVPTLRPTIGPNASREDIVAANRLAQTHARWAQATVVGGYLLYSMAASVATALAFPNFFVLLDLDPRTVPEADEAFEASLKSAWRKLVRRAHPDVVGSQGENAFVAMRTAYETLGDPIKRDAYER